MTSSPPFLTEEQGKQLVRLARKALTDRLDPEQAGTAAETTDPADDDPALQTVCGTFVTLKLKGELRGCIGNLSAQEPLTDSVRHNAVNAAIHDPRFSPLTAEELARVRIEVSVLTAPRPLQYHGKEELLDRIRPGVDGVTLRKGCCCATFLPQVWEKLPDPADFLDNLCYKMGAAPDLWRKKHLDVLVYQVEEFHE